MDKKTFVEYTRGNVETKLHHKIPVKVIDACLYSLIESLIQVVESGDEVRLPPFGVFYPRASVRPGTTKLISARIGFNSFAETNKRITSQIKKIAVFRLNGEQQLNLLETGTTDGNLGTVRFVADGGKTRIQDDKGRELYNLSEIAKMSGLSYPTAQKYILDNLTKIEIYDNGTGKKYPASVANVLAGLRKRKNTKRYELEGLYTLTDVAKRTGITTVTLYNYLKKYPQLVPITHRGKRSYYNDDFIKQVEGIRNTNREKWGG